MYDPLYLQGIEHFNVCDFYEAHDAWEELWTDYRGPSRTFNQGMIQAAVGLFHFGNGNIRGPRSCTTASRITWNRFGRITWGSTWRNF